MRAGLTPRPGISSGGKRSASSGGRARVNIPMRPRVFDTQAILACGGNNLGWREARGEFVIFLNPDCVIEPDCAEALIRPLIERPGEIGVTGAKLYYPNSHILQHAGGIIHENAMSEHRGMGQLDTGRFDAPAEVPYVTGAAMAMRSETCCARADSMRIFPAYYEEADLSCVRRRLA
jgi:GT2 family glycosyltransferase